MKLISYLSIAILIVVATSFNTYSQSDEFKYQGNLVFNGQPANGSYDFEFRLFSSSVGGTQIGTTQTHKGIQVTNGNFAVSLLFDDGFTGGTRYLDISVRPAGSGAYTALTPRTLVSTTPYAMRSTNAFQAQNAVSAETAVSAQTAAFAEQAGNAITAGSADFAANATNATNATTAATASNALALGGVASNQFVLTGDVRLSDFRNPLPGSTSYIQNQNAAPQNANLSINGNANIGGSITSSSGTMTGKLAVGSGSPVAPSITFTEDADTGIFRSSANTLNFSTNGTSRIQIDPSGNTIFGGNISLPSSTRFLAISPAAFQPQDSSMTFAHTLRFYGLSASQAVIFSAPIYLPHGATVTEVRAVIYDNSTANMTFGLARTNQTSGSTQFIASTVSSGTSATAQSYPIQEVFFPTIDNQNYVYLLRAEWTVPQSVADLGIVSFRITYNVTSPLP